MKDLTIIATIVSLLGLIIWLSVEVETAEEEWCLVQIMPDIDNSEYFGWSREAGEVARFIKNGTSWRVYQRCNKEE